MIPMLVTIAALTAAPADPVTVSGQAVSMPAPRMFTVLAGDRRVLVYANPGAGRAGTGRQPGASARHRAA